MQDAFGWITEPLSPEGSMLSYAYDQRNRLIDLTHRDAFGAPFSRQTYTRADTGHKTSLTELDGRSVDYTCNPPISHSTHS